MSFDLTVKSTVAVELLEDEPLEEEPLEEELPLEDELPLEEEEPLEEEFKLFTAVVRALSVFPSAVPVCERPLAFWNALRAAIDFSPNIPSIEPV